MQHINFILLVYPSTLEYVFKKKIHRTCGSNFVILSQNPVCSICNLRVIVDDSIASCHILYKYTPSWSSNKFLCMLLQGGLQPSHRRSLFTLASFMLIFSARIGDFPGLIPIVKASLTENTVSFFTQSLKLSPIQYPYSPASF